MPTPDEQAAISAHLDGLQYANIPPQFSAFFAAVRDARAATGRDMITGAVSQGAAGNPGNWSGALTYLALLDQIGDCFRPQAGASTAPSAVDRALEDFAGLQEPQRRAIYALRCAFAHDYSLINIDAAQPLLQHHFIVSANAIHPLVTLPVQQWDGQYESRNAQNVTRINLRTLGDTVEQIISRLLSDAANSQLELRLQGGADELRNRYWMGIFEEQVPEPPPQAP
ncbi:MAG: hypothetical protein H7A21_08000 [Spirochaetales bacterium]|nr:hypothetical protein [Spirochaetales bacterium]MCP5486096.1 hypothetical protein [Spirochaetales bacterium]